ncbi:MAG: cob(I)yrinic acid a,c-diamide adenosyltransferase [Methanosphaera stadtmanae]|nr:cob(I)yrinic acid a,c-diamide adenosyltransferase [Methanosphaera stadtmanae]
MKKASVYTRTGDKGTTGLYTGERIAKNSMRVEAYGNVDEITSALGLARVTATRDDIRETILELEKKLSSLMADLASINLSEPYIKESDVKEIESMIDDYDSMLEPLSNFLLPGNTLAEAALDMARTSTRRAERQLLRLAAQEDVNPNVLIYINRVSDLCFIMGRVESEIGNK